MDSWSSCGTNDFPNSHYGVATVTNVEFHIMMSNEITEDLSDVISTVRIIMKSFFVYIYTIRIRQPSANHSIIMTRGSVSCLSCVSNFKLLQCSDPLEHHRYTRRDH